MDDPPQRAGESDSSQAVITNETGTNAGPGAGSLALPDDDEAAQNLNPESKKKSSTSPPEQALQFTRSKIMEVVNAIDEAKPNPQPLLNSIQAFGLKTFGLGKKKRQRSLPDANGDDLMLDTFPALINRDDIRLILLEQSEYPNSIPVCMLKTARLGSHPVFEALSWAWGDRWQETQMPIYFQQREWHVPGNLYDALVSLRRTNRSRLLWIDALCINQGGSNIALEERAQQIRLMRHIYSFASHVIIWMGLPQEELAVSFLTTLENGDFVEASTIDPEGTYCILNTILEHPWWTRLWVLQESALSEMSSIQYGQVSVSFRDFLANLRDFEWYIYFDSNGSQGWKLKLNVHRFVRLFTLVQKHAGASGILEGRRQLPWERERNQDHGILRAQLQLFLRLLSDCRHQLTTDPHDKIYGLLGLVDDSVAALIDPSYNEKVEYTYTRTCGVIAHKTQSLDCLSIVAKKGQKSKLSLPSWVPDWTKTFTEQQMSRDARLERVISQMQLLSEIGNNINSIAFDGTGMLHAKGLKVDRIICVSGQMPGLPQFDFTQYFLQRLWVAKLYVLLGRMANGEKPEGAPGPIFHWINRNSNRFAQRYIQRWVRQTPELSKVPGVPPNADEVLYVSEENLEQAQDDVAYGRFHYEGKQDWKLDMRYICGESFFRAYWKMLCHGVAPTSRHNPDELPIWDKMASMETFELQGDPSDWEGHLTEHFRTTLENRTLFVTEDGFLGNASDASEGDIVFILRGARLPVVLRPKPDRPGRYKFVGECYIPGIMGDHNSTFYLASSRRRTWMQTKTAELGHDGMHLLDLPTDMELQETILLA